MVDGLQCGEVDYLRRLFVLPLEASLVQLIQRLVHCTVDVIERHE